MAKLRPVVKIHGGKSYHQSWVLENFPDDYEQYTYVEPCCGGASVCLNKKRSRVEEVINDIHPGLVAIFKALRDEPKEFVSRLRKIGYRQSSFLKALERCNEKLEDYVETGIVEYTIRRMSRGGMKKAFAWSDRTRGGQPGDVNAWKTMLKQLPLIAQRLQGVRILNRDLIEILKVWDEPNTLFYIDPPYLPSTRTKGSTEVYDYEMSVDDHIKMLKTVMDLKGKVLLSGYSSTLYNKHLKGWRTSKRESANHSSQQKVKERRIEVLWANY
jgi:DNA adenine methylase